MSVLAEHDRHELVELREYQSVEKKITADRALELASTRMVSVHPAWAPGTFEITAGAVVGAVRLAGGIELRVTPKLPVRRVVYLLAHAAGLTTWDERLLKLNDDARIDVALAAAFVVAAERALRRGPYSGYYTVEADLQEFRGRIDANQQRRRFGFPLPIDVIYDEYGPDIAENQLLAGSTQLLGRLPTLPSDLRQRLRRVARSLDAVQTASRRNAHIPVNFTRLNEHYRSAVALARAVLDNASFDVAAGRRSVTGFTVKMYELFEKFLQVTLTDALESRYEGRLRAQRADHLDEACRARIVPDLTWVIDGVPSAVIDAKYKSIADGIPADDDVYQVIAYCVALGVSRAYLVHATMPAAPLVIAVRSSNIEIHTVGVNLAAPIPELRRQIEALADSIAIKAVTPA